MRKRKLWVSIVAGLLAAVMLFGLIASLIPVANAASSSEIKKQIETLKESQKEMEAQMDELESQRDDNITEINQIVALKDSIDQQIGILYAQVEVINQQVAAYNVLIADKQDELDEAEDRLAKLREMNRERIRAMEEDGKLSYWSVLFKANSFSDLLDRLSMIEEIAEADERRIREMNAAAKTVADARNALVAERAELETARAELDAAQAELDAKRAEADALLTQLLAQGDELQAVLDDFEQRHEDLLEELEQAEDDLDEAKRKEYQQWLSTSVPDPEPPEIPPNTGGWIKPCKYRRVSSPFGDRIHPVYGIPKFHNGIDLAGPKGTPIYAVKSGTVTGAYWDEAGGYMVKIDHHDGFVTLYLHMTHYIVKKGDIVAQGQKIGEMGSTGTSTGSHLHFSIKYKGEYVNPAKYIDF